MKVGKGSRFHAAIAGAVLVYSCAAVFVSADETSVALAELGCGPQVCDQGAALRETYAGAVAQWPAAETTGGVAAKPLSPFVPSETSRDDPWVEIGKSLFFDPILSGSGQFACASCHHPDLAFTDGLRTAVGTGRTLGRRNTPTLLDKANQPFFMWDGAASSLEHQALLPIASPIEMAADHAKVSQRVNSHPEYADLFHELTGRSDVTIADVSAALGAYQKTLSRRTKFDRFMTGERDILSHQQLFGLHTFRTKARCMTCHSGPRLTDDQFHNLGLHFYGRSREDLGRYLVTGEPADIGAFRTPSLRHVSRTKPYTHNGLIPTLQGVVNLYDHGGARPRPRAEFAGDPLFPTTSSLLPELDLTADEKAALIAFLEIL